MDIHNVILCVVLNEDSLGTSLWKVISYFATNKEPKNPNKI